MIFAHDFKAVCIEVRGMLSDNNERNSMVYCNRLAMALHDAAEYNRKRYLFATADRYQAMSDSIQRGLEKSGFYSYSNNPESGCE